jgi:hypothetical protein
MYAMALACRFEFVSIPQRIFSAELEKPVSSLYKATETSSRGCYGDFKKKSGRALKVTDFKITACPPTSTLKLKLLMLYL